MSISVFSKLIYFSIFLLQCRSAVLTRIFVFHFRNVTFVTISKKCFDFVLCTLSNIGLVSTLFCVPYLTLGCSRKKTKRRWGVEDMEFLGVPKKQNTEFPKVSLKRCKISRVYKKKNWNIQWSRFLVLKFSVIIANTTLRYRNSKNEALFCRGT